MATTRRTPRNIIRRPSPIRDLLAEKQRAVELARARQNSVDLTAELPSLIETHVGEQMQRLEEKLVNDFRQLGKFAVEESTTVLNDKLQERIQTLEEVSAMQTKTLASLRDSSRVAGNRMGSAIDSIERSLSDAVPGLQFDPPAVSPTTHPGYAHPQFQLDRSEQVVKADPRDVEEFVGSYGFCPSCTSTDIRRANRQGLFEEFLRLFFIAPFRCRACRHKFFKF